ncbi:hypothetical protein EE612_027289 [Oryza sativa]|nr:hypothetical protein EE612_027289 [Oryza sativa]
MASAPVSRAPLTMPAEMTSASIWRSAREAATTSARETDWPPPPSPPPSRSAGSASLSARKRSRDDDEVATSSPIRSVSPLNTPRSSAISRPPLPAGASRRVDGRRTSPAAPWSCPTPGASMATATATVSLTPAFAILLITTHQRLASKQQPNTMPLLSCLHDPML